MLVFRWWYFSMV